MSLTITNIRVFDGNRITKDSAVRIVDGWIDAVGGPELADPSDQVVDGAGGTLLPGLIDTHLHLLPGAPHQAVTFGVTTIIDQFSKPELVTPILAGNGSSDVAEVRTSSIGATAPGGHPTMAYSPFPYVTGPEEASGFVADRLAEGATHLKVLYDDGSTSPVPMPSLDLGTVRALVEAAHAAEIIVIAHVMTAAAAVDVVNQGVDVLAHVPFELLNPTQVETLAAAEVAVIATLDIADGFPDSEGRMPLLTQLGLATRLGSAWTGMLERQAQRWMPPGLPDFAAARRNVHALHSCGVVLLAGTDAPNPGLVPGASLHRELQHLTEAGLSPCEALAAATSRPADVFGLNDRGAILPGKRADLLLVAGCPDQEIVATQAIAAVWKQGIPVVLDAYGGSVEEDESLASLQATNEKIIAAITEMWPKISS
ncbi:MAG: amidohydrolase family protein [Arthrobacter sp.]|uniref:amidohydrolase family protein n=1 Tax=unclassified Arthrobacter TaxID=235627 RepID=UPI003FB6D6D1